MVSEVLQHSYLALPKTQEDAPAIMVIHAWWGLNDFFKQFCDRLAQAGFVVFAPDLYNGKIATTIEQAATYRDEMDWAKTISFLQNAVAILRQHPQTIHKPIGTIGFSLGAYMALALLEKMPQDVCATVLFYGIGEGDFVGRQAAVLGHFAEHDEYENKDEIDKLEHNLKTSGAETIFYTYPDTEHWFFESNQPTAYKADAAQLAWERTLNFLNTHL